MKQPGIYLITNTACGKTYVGSSVQMANRWYKHLSQLRRGIHNNAHLQAAFTRDGEALMQFTVLEVCEVGSLLAREQHYLDTLRPEYNICAIAGNTLGYKHSPAAKAKMSLANMGNQRTLGHTLSTETRLKIAAHRRGTKLTEAHIARIREANRGNQHTAGHTLSAEHREKVSTGLRQAWEGKRDRQAAADRLRARWSDPAWKAQQLERIASAKAAKRAAGGLE